MIYIIPITGDAGCGKTYFCERFKEFYENETTYIDTSFPAKDFFESIRSVDTISTPALESAMSSKDNKYRDALNSVINILDSFGLRFKYTTQIIESFIDSRMKESHTNPSYVFENLYIFINVRDLDFIKRIHDYCDLYGYKFFLILMTDKKTPIKSDLDIDCAENLYEELLSYKLASHTLYIRDSLSCIYSDESLNSLLKIFEGTIPINDATTILHQEPPSISSKVRGLELYSNNINTI